MNKKGLALVITAPSGAGKTTLINMLLNEFPEITFSISYTTRPPREGEVHGKHYFFITKEEFEKLIKENFFAEWAVVHKNYYGTPLNSLLKTLENGKDVLFDIDIQGAKQLKRTVPDSVSVFILPPSKEVLFQRLIKRGKDTKESIKIRLKRAKEELSSAFEFDFLILNDDLNKAYEQLKSIYIAEKCKTARSKKLLENLLTRWS